MSLLLSANRIRLTDTDGRVALDTNTPMFVETSFHTGTINIPARPMIPAFGGRLWIQKTFTTIASVSSDADAVMGAFKVASTTQGVPAGPWFNAGGTYMHFIYPGACNGSYSLTSVTNNIVVYLDLLTFAISGGQLQLEEQLILPYNPSTLIGSIASVDGFTITYRISVGAFV